MKKLFSILLVVLMSFSLVACGGGNTGEKTGGGNDTSSQSALGEKTLDEVSKIAKDKGYIVADLQDYDLFLGDVQIAEKGISLTKPDDTNTYAIYKYGEFGDATSLGELIFKFPLKEISPNLYAYDDESMPVPPYYWAVGEENAAFIYTRDTVDEDYIIDFLFELGFPVK